MLSFEERRLISDPEGAEYTNMGITKFREWSERIGAVRRIGRRRVNDKKVIDQFLDRGQMDGCTVHTDGQTDS